MAVLRDDPYPGLNFHVLVEGIFDDGSSVRGAFSEVSGLGVEVEPIEYRTGSETLSVRKVPGLAKYTNIVLKRGVIGDTAFFQWIRTVLNGQVQRANGVITLLDESRQPVVAYRFRRGWPCKWTGPTLNAKNNEVALESLEICHEGLEIE